MTAIPIVFYHAGNSDYLKYTLRQTRFYNPNSPIYLLGDGSNNLYPCVNHALISDYSSSGNLFRNIYVHKSLNSYEFEWMCFFRWFCIRDFCRAKGITAFFYLDSDVLVYQNITELIPLLQGARFSSANLGTYTPSFIYFADFEMINDFCHYITRSYTDNQLLKFLDCFFEAYKRNNQYGGVCDMTILGRYAAGNPFYFNMLSITDNLSVDIAIGDANGYEIVNGLKKVYWKRRLPYCKRLSDRQMVRFVCLHFQGPAKDLIGHYYTAGGYHYAKLKERSLRLLKKVYRRYFSSIYRFAAK